MEWKNFADAMPDSGDTIIVFDGDEFAVFIYMQDGDGREYLDAAWDFGIAGDDWQIQNRYLWMPCPMPPVVEGDK